jgi:hypothetical protein
MAGWFRERRHRYIDGVDSDLVAAVGNQLQRLRFKIDPGVADHSYVVGHLAYCVASHMHFSRDVARAAYVVGSLHEVGRLTVPEVDEREALSLGQSAYRLRYARIALASFDILTDDPMLWPYAPGILEFYGEPPDLSLPVRAAIVANAFDVYGSTETPAATLDYLRKNPSLDQAIVDGLEAMLFTKQTEKSA